MSVVAKAYAHICEALDRQPTFQKFLADQTIEWGKISVRRLDKHRSSTEEALLNFAVLPLPSRSLSIPEKAMVLVAIYNARCAGRDPINPWHDKPPKSRMLKRVQTLIQAQSYDQDDDEFGLTMDDIPTIRSYVDEIIEKSGIDESAAKPRQTHITSTKDENKRPIKRRPKGKIHASADEPPESYRRCKKQDESPLGAITGSKGAIGFALHRNDNLTDQGYRDHFWNSLGSGVIWVRKSLHNPGKFEAFILATNSSKADDDLKKLNAFQIRAEAFESRENSRKSSSKKNSSKVKASEPKSNKAS